MYAIALLRFRATPALAGLGFLSFIVFGFTEMLRTSLGIFVLNRTWRAGSVTATDDGARSWLRAAIETYSGVNDFLFFLFYLTFLLGILCYGLSLATAKGLDRQVGWLFLLWTALNVPPSSTVLRGLNRCRGGSIGLGRTFNRLPGSQ